MRDNAAANRAPRALGAVLVQEQPQAAPPATAHKHHLSSHATKRLRSEASAPQAADTIAVVPGGQTTCEDTLPNKRSFELPRAKANEHTVALVQDNEGVDKSELE